MSKPVLRRYCVYLIYCVQKKLRGLLHGAFTCYRGAGFVGSHPAEELLQRGDEVFIIDDLCTGRIDNIEPLKRNPKFHYIIDSLQNKPALAELIDRYDVVYHFSAAVGVKLIVESPVNAIETTMHSAEVVLKLANKKKKKVLNTSTSVVYGKSIFGPLPRRSGSGTWSDNKGSM